MFYDICVIPYKVNILSSKVSLVTYGVVGSIFVANKNLYDPKLYVMGSLCEGDIIAVSCRSFLLIKEVKDPARHTETLITSVLLLQKI